MTATAEAPASEIVDLLADREMIPLAELAELVDAKVIGRAWFDGLIEFGRPAYCTAGAPAGEEGSVLILEGGMDWTGPKSVRHKTYAGLAGEGLPECGRYERADVPMVPRHDPKNDRTTYHRPAVGRAEAEKLTALQVRLAGKAE